MAPPLEESGQRSTSTALFVLWTGGTWKPAAGGREGGREGKREGATGKTLAAEKTLAASTSKTLARHDDVDPDTRLTAAGPRSPFPSPLPVSAAGSAPRLGRQTEGLKPLPTSAPPRRSRPPVVPPATRRRRRSSCPQSEAPLTSKAGPAFPSSRCFRRYPLRQQSPTSCSPQVRIYSNSRNI